MGDQAALIRGKLAALVMVAVVSGACSSGPAQRAATHPTASPHPGITAAAPTSTPVLRPPGSLQYSQQSIAQNLVAPWAIDFARDGSIWLTERPGRVRVIRNGTLLAEPAVSLNVATGTTCEDGLLGLALQEPYAYLYYTYRGSAGNTNRVSRFSIAGDKLGSEQVLVDGIPGGTCYHFGGRLKLGPDGYLYFTTGEGFVASRATDPNNLSGKIMRVATDGSNRQVYAWGFRNPQGLAWDRAGRLYVSNHGPTGDLGLCCHDEIDLIKQGGFYGWPWWAAGTRTSYAGNPPARIGPLAESGDATWAPSGMTFYAPTQDQEPTLLLAELKGMELRRFIFDPADPARVTSQEIVLQGQGRLRDAVAGPDRCLYVLTSNRDTRGTPRPNDDQVLKLCPR